ncbi:hypothetical protein ROZALSC1DRAFT_27814, partial [Rozella allomycis CSF55]
LDSMTKVGFKERERLELHLAYTRLSLAFEKEKYQVVIESLLKIEPIIKRVYNCQNHAMPFLKWSHNMALCYMYQGNFKTSILFFKKALSMNSLIKDQIYPLDPRIPNTEPINLYYYAIALLNSGNAVESFRVFSHLSCKFSKHHLVNHAQFYFHVAECIIRYSFEKREDGNTRELPGLNFALRYFLRSISAMEIDMKSQRSKLELNEDELSFLKILNQRDILSTWKLPIHYRELKALIFGYLAAIFYKIRNFTASLLFAEKGLNLSPPCVCHERFLLYHYAIKSSTFLNNEKKAVYLCWRFAQESDDWSDLPNIQFKIAENYFRAGKIAMGEKDNRFQ